MNQKQAQILMKLNREDAVEMMEMAGVNADNIAHIERFAEDGEYHVLAADGIWGIHECPLFNRSPDNYGPVPKICWKKAMKNGAWGERFLFSDSGKDWNPGTLLGYQPHYDLPFREHVRWKYCKPIPGFEIPESWLEDE